MVVASEDMNAEGPGHRRTEGFQGEIPEEQQELLIADSGETSGLRYLPAKTGCD